jgi:hypothetical protein
MYIEMTINVQANPKRTKCTLSLSIGGVMRVRARMRVCVQKVEKIAQDIVQSNPGAPTLTVCGQVRESASNSGKLLLYAGAHGAACVIP